MNAAEKQEAYRKIKERYSLKAAQRDALDASPKLDEMLEFAHKGRWTYLSILLEGEGILDAPGPTVININGANYGTIQM